MTTLESSDTPKKSIIVLGGSYGGISVTHYLLKHVLSKLPDMDTYEVVLVNPSAEVLDRPACPRALISDDLLPQDKLFVNIPRLFEIYPKNYFRFIQGAAIELKHTESRISIAQSSGGTSTLQFHALVVATGASTPSPLLSINRDTAFLRDSWAKFRDALPRAKTIVIAGGGPAGIETAGELGEYLNGRAGFLGAKAENPKCAITVVTAQSKILPVLRPAIAADAETMLAKLGVAVIKNARVASVAPGGAGTDDVGAKATVTLEGGKTLEADLYIPATGTVPNTGFVARELLAADGRVRVNAATFRVDDAVGARIYAIGDVASATRPAVHNIFPAVPVLCANMKKDLLLAAGDGGAEGMQDREFKEDTREAQFVPIGRGKGVGAVLGYRVPSFLVWAIKGRDYWLWTLGNLWSGKQWAKES